MKREELITPIAIFLALIFVGAYVYTFLEGWRYLDALYFAVVTATTVGYGDIYPHTDAGKIFTILYAFATIGIAFYFFTLVGRYFFTHRLKKELLESRQLKERKGVETIKV